MTTDTATRRRGDAQKNRESGYALLLIFAMAAAAAVMLYLELPRVAFEAQRTREQTLIERGEQYQRAIQLYFRKFKTYPPSIEALEGTNNIRFLRRRYTDPLTGKDEWRLIHVGPGGVFLDSLTHKPDQGKKPEANLNTFITEGPAIGSSLPDPQQSTAGPPRRASEGGQPQPGTDGSAASVIPGQLPGISNNPSQQGQADAQPGGAQSPNPPFPGMPGANLPTSAGGQLGLTGTSPGDPSQPAMPGGVPGALGPDPNQQGMSPSDLIGNLLKQPRPVPPAGGTPMTGGTAMMGGGTTMMGGGQVGGGIAGVASKVEKASIKIYNDREKYNEWEFIYDYSKDRTGAGRAAAAMGTPQQGTTPGAGGPGTGQPGAFGVQSGIGGPTGLGAQPGFGAQAGTAGGFGSNTSASGSSGSSGGGGVGSGFGGGVGSGFGTQPPSTTPSQPQPQQPANPGQQPTQQQPAPQPAPQPGPIPAPPPPPNQNATPPQ